MSTPIRDLIAGNRIFAHHGVLDAYGHVTIRDPENPNQFIMSRARAPELVAEDDLMHFNFAGELLDAGDKRGPYQERFIHGSIYEARPDVQAVCHSHTPSIIPFGVTDIPLRAVFHMGASIGVSVPVWDIADEFPDTNLLVTNVAQGRSLAKKLGEGRMALMRGHGCVFVGRNVPDLVRTGVYMDVNARMATTAHLMSNGKVHYLSDSEVRMRLNQPGGPAPSGLQAGAGGDGGGREWEAWCAQVGILDE